MRFFTYLLRMKLLKRIFGTALLLLFALVVGALIWARCAVFNPAPTMPATLVSSPQTPVLHAGQTLKIMSWNVQFMAGKGRTFFFDLPGSKGPDERPTRAEIEHALPEVARVIREENPDVVMFQELDDGAARTDKDDQLARLLALLPKEYSEQASTFYWKMSYVPHPKIHGAVGLKLGIISKYKIASAQRIALPQAQHPPIVDWFQFKRCLLETHFPIDSGGDLVIMNTHLEAMIQNSDLKHREVMLLDSLFAAKDSLHEPWIQGGDFNLLAPGMYAHTPKEEQVWFNPAYDLGPLYSKYLSLPTLGMLMGPDSLLARTHYPNRPDSKGLDKTIDYFFRAQSVVLDTFFVRQFDTQKISDHAPIVMKVNIPNKNNCGC